MSSASDELKSRIENIQTSAFIGRNFGLTNASSVVISATNGSTSAPTITLYDNLGNSEVLDTTDLPTNTTLGVCVTRASNGGACQTGSGFTTGVMQISLTEPYGAISLYQNGETQNDSDIEGIKLSVVQGKDKRGFYFDRNTFTDNNS